MIEVEQPSSKRGCYNSPVVSAPMDFMQADASDRKIFRRHISSQSASARHSWDG